MKTKFTGKGGYDSQIKSASEVLTIGEEYTIIGGSIGRYDSTYILEGIKGVWNTAMFDVPWEDVQDLMKHSYLNYYGTC